MIKGEKGWTRGIIEKGRKIKRGGGRDKIDSPVFLRIAFTKKNPNKTIQKIPKKMVY